MKSEEREMLKGGEILGLISKIFVVILGINYFVAYMLLSERCHKFGLDMSSVISIEDLLFDFVLDKAVFLIILIVCMLPFFCFRYYFAGSFNEVFISKLKLKEYIKKPKVKIFIFSIILFFILLYDFSFFGSYGKIGLYLVAIFFLLILPKKFDKFAIVCFLFCFLLVFMGYMLKQNNLNFNNEMSKISFKYSDSNKLIETNSTLHKIFFGSRYLVLYDEKSQETHLYRTEDIKDYKIKNVSLK